MADFKRREDVEAWVAQHGLKELEWALSTGKFSEQSFTVAQAWQWEQVAEENAKEGERQAKEAERSRDLSERAVRAAESSAAAARDSATWSRLAAVIATAALLISALPFIRP